MKKTYILALASALCLSAMSLTPKVSLSKVNTPDSLRRPEKTFQSPNNQKFQATVEPDGTYLLVDEHFDKFSAGSEENPDQEFVCDFNGKPYIDDSLTVLPGWSGTYVSQAGGMAAINTPVGGCINTPEGDYSGEITVSFRARLLTSTGQMIVSLNDEGIMFPLGIAQEIVGNMNGEDGWKDYSFTFSNPNGSSDAFVQINVPYCSLLIDDLKVTSRVTDFIATPKVLPATEFCLDGFKANWSNVTGADHYIFDMYKEEISDPTPIDYSIDFESSTLSNGILTGVPEGFTYEGLKELRSDVGEEGTRALIIANDALLTTHYDATKIIDYSVWFRILNGKPNVSSVEIQGWNGYDWRSLGTLPLATVPSDELGAELNLSYAVPGFAYKYERIKLVFTGLAEEGIEIAADNINYTTSPKAERVNVITGDKTNETFKVLTGLDPDTEYYYEITAVHGDMTAKSAPMLAFGVTTPEVLPASDVNGFAEYTANWVRTPKATSYMVRNYDVYTCPDDEEKSHIVLHEDFSKVEGPSSSDFGNAESFDNPYDDIPLDDYTANIGWIGCGNAIFEGMMGCDWSQGYSAIYTPALHLCNNNGDFTVKVTVLGYEGDNIIVSASSANCDNSSIYIGKDGEPVNVTLNFTGGTDNEVLTFYSSYGAQFFIDDITVEQNLTKGNRVLTLANSQIIDDGDICNHKFSGLTTGANLSHAYDVTAIYAKYTNTCKSAPSDKIYVKNPSSVSGVTSDESESITINGNSISVNMTESAYVTIYDIYGRSVAQEHGKELKFTLPQGLYIIRTPSRTIKVLLEN